MSKFLPVLCVGPLYGNKNLVKQFSLLEIEPCARGRASRIYFSLSKLSFVGGEQGIYQEFAGLLLLLRSPSLCHLHCSSLFLNGNTPSSDFGKSILPIHYLKRR